MAKKKGKKSSAKQFKQWQKMARRYGWGAPASAWGSGTGLWGSGGIVRKKRKTLLRRLGLRGWLGSAQAEQFIIGLLLGGGATYVLGDEEARERVMQGAVRLYTSVMGSVEEFKEQLADIQAEVAAEHATQADM